VSTLGAWMARGCPVQFVDPETGAYAFTIVLTQDGAKVVDPAPTYSDEAEQGERSKNE
jgi:hypothetical protein